MLSCTMVDYKILKKEIIDWTLLENLNQIKNQLMIFFFWKKTSKYRKELIEFLYSKNLIFLEEQRIQKFHLISIYLLFMTLL